MIVGYVEVELVGAINLSKVEMFPGIRLKVVVINMVQIWSRLKIRSKWNGFTIYSTGIRNSLFNFKQIIVPPRFMFGSLQIKKLNRRDHHRGDIIGMV